MSNIKEIPPTARTKKGNSWRKGRHITKRKGKGSFMGEIQALRKGIKL